jgi:hypothetical protein
MKKYLESIIVIRRVGLLASTLVPLVVAAMGIADVKATPDTPSGDAISPFTLLTSSNDTTISENPFVRGNEATGYPDTLQGDAINFGRASLFTVLSSSNDTMSENSFVGGNTPTTYPDTLPGGAINFGRASSFTVLTHSNDAITGGSNVHGNVGIQSGTFSLDRNSDVYGNLVYHAGVMRHIQGNVTGTQTQNDPAIDNALMDAQMLSDAAFAEPVTSRYAGLTMVNLNGGSLTITGGANEKVVLKLTNFVLAHGADFTLQGTATTSFLVNITGNFALSGGSNISLLNVPVANVLFNIRGHGTFNISGGSNISGNLLALNGTVNISGGSNITGVVIANQVNLSNNSNVNAVSPTRNP